MKQNFEYSKKLKISVKKSCFATGLIGLLVAAMISACTENKKDAYTQQLTDWKIAPAISAVTPSLNAIAVTAADEVVAAANFSTTNWLPAVAPSTVLGNLVDNGVYDYLFEPDNDGKINVYFNDNFSKIPTEDFNNEWWYSADFSIPSKEAGKRITLTFKGISYTGEIYVNGTKIANKYTNITEEDYLKNGPTLLDPNAEITDYTTPGAGSLTGVSDWETYKSQFIGTMRTYDIDITDFVTIGKGKNNVKVKIKKPVYRNDLTYYWVDWNPQPADAMMGLTGEVFLHVSGSARLANPAVASKVSRDHRNASLSFFVDVSNFTKTAVSGKLTAVIKDPKGNTIATLTKENINIPADAYNKEIEIRPSEFPQLNLTNPQLWWPYLSGDQPLYTIDYEFSVNGVVSDRLHHRFGIREITEEVNVSPYANEYSDSISTTHLANMQQIYVNHRPVLLKGGGYCATDLMLRHDKSVNEAVVEYLKYMGMNMIRDEGKFFDNDLLALMDEAGIVLMTGWCCCDRWQSPGQFSKAERFVAYESMYSQLRNARRFTCMVLWYNGSDDPPSILRQGENGQNVEQKYFEIAADLRWLEMGANCSNGSAKLATLTNVVGGQHMDATYDSQTPTWYYYEPRGNFGFISEGGGGASIPIQETMRRIIPEANFWPYNSAENYNIWNYHTCRGGFNNLGQHTTIIDGTYGASATFDEFITRAQIFQYDMQRAQYEALGFYRYKNTSGLVNWMLNNAWPIMYWNQFDYYMNPNGSTFGARKGNEPVHIMYSMYYKSVHVLNNTFDTYNGAVAKMSIYDIHGNLINTPLEKTINIRADGVPAAVEYATAGSNRLGPKTIGLIKGSLGAYEPYQVNYYGKITEAYGVTDLWEYDDIQASLIRPTTDVYFIRLELVDANGKSLSINSYAEPMRNDVAGASKAWNRSGAYQVADMTQLNQLPPVDLKSTRISSKREGNRRTLTYRISNPSGNIAYAVELRAYTDRNMKTLVAPVLYEDNLFTLFPGESRDIKISYNQSDLSGNAIVTVNCYNNVINGSNARYATNIYMGTPMGGSNNIARAKTVTGGNNSQNVTEVPNAGQTNAINGKTFLESNKHSFATLSQNDEGGAFIVDLGDVQSFDRIMLRWNRTNNLRGRPDNIKIEVSENNVTYANIANFDNSKMGAIMTNIVLPAQARGRYVKITPSGMLGLTAAVGMNTLAAGGVQGQSRSGIEAAAAAIEFTLSAVEIYAFNKYVFFTVEGAGNVEAYGKTITSTCFANSRVVKVGGNGTVTFKCTPASNVKVLLGGTDISSMMATDGTVTLTGVDADTDITVIFAR